MYTAYLLDPLSRKTLEKRFPPKYPDFIGHHITNEFGVDKDAKLPEAANIKVIGRADDGKGLEALVVSVDGKRERPDGKLYHLTWSLDKEAGRKPVESNDLVERGRWTLTLPIEITTKPTILE